MTRILGILISHKKPDNITLDQRKSDFTSLTEKEISAMNQDSDS